MADLTFQLLSAELPANSLSETADDVMISVKAIIGEAAVQLTSEKVSEFVSKLLGGCSAAQTTYNGSSPPNQLTSYPSPTLGAPRQLTTGEFVTSRTHTVTVVAPIQLDEIAANVA